MFRRRYENKLKRAWQHGYDQGCIDGWRNAEDAIDTWKVIVKRNAEREAKLAVEDEMREREDKAYTDGLRDSNLLS